MNDERKNNILRFVYLAITALTYPNIRFFFASIFVLFAAYVHINFKEFFISMLGMIVGFLCGACYMFDRFFDK